MDFSFIRKLLFSRSSQNENYRIKEEGNHTGLIEIAELTYESYHGRKPSIWDRLFMVIWTLIWFTVSSAFLIFGIGVIFWILGLRVIYQWIEEERQVETFYLDKVNNCLIKETVVFGDNNQVSWELDRIRKLLISLDIDLQRIQNATTGQSSTRRIKKYVVAMILNRETRSEKIGDFDVVELISTDIEPRLLEVCLELGKQFEIHGIPVERMVNLVRIEQTDILCRACNEFNRGNSLYCSFCGTHLDVDPKIIV